MVGTPISLKKSSMRRSSFVGFDTPPRLREPTPRPNAQGRPLDRVTVILRHSKVHAEDCAECETKTGMLDQIERDITMEGTLDPEQRRKLMEIADKCPVHRTLTSEVRIATREVNS